MEPYDSNKAELCRRFPAFKAGLDALDPESLGVARAADGGLCFARRKAGGAWEAVTDPKAPLQAAAAGVARMEPRLLKGLGPAVVVGLRPGHVLDSVYAHFKSRLKFNEPFRRVYVLVDNFEHLGCWLKVSDRSELLTRAEVEFFRAEDLEEIVRLCEADEQRSHLFIPVSELPEDKLNALIAPLADFYLRREAETARLKAANDAYYDALSDAALAAALQGEAGRAPRLMALAHRSSQVVQFSARDTCAAFTKLGWETKLLLIEQDLSPWRLAKAIAGFKPDVFLMVNHLRTENGEHLSLYPANMLFVTWVQDSMPSVNRHDAAELWNAMASPRRRDLLIGYVDQLRPFGYLAERLFPCSMVVNTDIFHLRELTAEQKEKYGCDVCFASNRSKTTEEILASELAPALEPRGFARATLEEIHAALWREYRDGATFTSYGELKDFLLGFAAFREVFARLAADDQGNVVETVFWRLNDVIYRHVVLEWLDELGVKLNLYGQGWEKHPRFAKHAQGPVAHGEELSVAYQAAKFCLHLNSMEGSHQRLLEILATGGAPLMRAKNLGRLMSPDLAEALRFAAKKLYGFDAVPATGLSPEQERQLNDFLFRLAQNASRQDPGAVGEALPAACGREARRWLETRPDWLVPDWRGRHFSDKAELDKLLRGARTTATAPSSQRQPLIDAATAGALREAVLTTLATSPAAAGFPFELGPSRFSAALDAAAPTPELKAAFAATPHPGFEMTSQLLTRLLVEGEQEEARALLERFAPESLDAPRRIDYAVFLARLGETKRAEALVADAYAEDGGLTDGFARLSWETFWPRNEYAKVIEGIEKDLYARPDRPRDADGGRLSAPWRPHLAQAYAASGDIAAAKRRIEAAYAADTELKDGHAQIGWGLFWPQWKHEDALAWFMLDAKAGRLSDAMTRFFATVLAANGRVAEARQLAAAEELDVDVAQGCLRAGRFAEALDLFKAARERGGLAKAHLDNFAAAAVVCGDHALLDALVKDSGLAVGAAVQLAINWHYYGLAALPDLRWLDALLDLDFQRSKAVVESYVGKLHVAFLQGNHHEAGLVLRLAERSASPADVCVVQLGNMALSALNQRDVDAPPRRFAVPEPVVPSTLATAGVWLLIAGDAAKGKQALDRLYHVNPNYFLGKQAMVFNQIMWLAAAAARAGDETLSARCVAFAKENALLYKHYADKLACFCGRGAATAVVELPPFRFPWTS